MANEHKIQSVLYADVFENFANIEKQLMTKMAIIPFLETSCDLETGKFLHAKSKPSLKEAIRQHNSGLHIWFRLNQTQICFFLSESLVLSFRLVFFLFFFSGSVWFRILGLV